MSCLRALVVIALALAGCGSAPPAAEPPEEPEPRDEPPAEEAIGLRQILAEDGGGEGVTIAEVLAGDVSEMSKKLAIAMGGEGAEFVVAPTEPDEGAPAPAPVVKRLGTLTLGTPEIMGGCAAEPIERVVRRRAGAARACYEQRLQLDHALEGVVEWRISIDSAGEVSHRTAKGMDDKELLACLERLAGRMRFDPPGATCVATYQLTFAPAP